MNCGQTVGKTWIRRYCQTPRVGAGEKFVDPTLRDRGTGFSGYLRIAYDRENHQESWWEQGVINKLEARTGKHVWKMMPSLRQLGALPRLNQGRQCRLP